jgi:hypothetical protein
LDADTWLAEVLWETGEAEEAEAVLLEAIAIGEQGIFPPVGLCCRLSVYCSRRGEIGAARDLLFKARDASSGLGATLLHDGWLSLAEAHLAVAQGDWAQAWASFEATADCWARIGLRWYRARTLIDWAEAHLARGAPGDQERAQELLREAEAEFEAMGAPVYVERVQGRLDGLGAVGR